MSLLRFYHPCDNNRHGSTSNKSESSTAVAKRRSSTRKHCSHRLLQWEKQMCFRVTTIEYSVVHRAAYHVTKALLLIEHQTSETSGQYVAWLSLRHLKHVYVKIRYILESFGILPKRSLAAESEFSYRASV